MRCARIRAVEFPSLGCLYNTVRQGFTCLVPTSECATVGGHLLTQCQQSGCSAYVSVPHGCAEVCCGPLASR